MDADPTPPSLVARLFRGDGEGRRVGPAVALGVAALLGLGPVATIAGAGLIAQGTRQQTATIARQAAPQLMRLRAGLEARTTLQAALAAPTLAATLDGLTRALPGEAAVVSAQRRDGRLRIEVASPDPDRLRTSLRRHPTTTRLRDAGQRRLDTGMLVALEDRDP